MAIPMANAALDWRKLMRSAGYAEMFTRRLEPMVPRPSVYDWRKPTEHPPGYFILRPDPYEWFDPTRGRAVKVCPDPIVRWTVHMLSPSPVEDTSL